MRGAGQTFGIRNSEFGILGRGRSGFGILGPWGQACFYDIMALKASFQCLTWHGQAYFYNIMALKVRFQWLASHGQT